MLEYTVHGYRNTRPIFPPSSDIFSYFEQNRKFAASKPKARSHQLRYRNYLSILLQLPMNRVDMMNNFVESGFDVLMRAPSRLKADYFKHAILKYFT